MDKSPKSRSKSTHEIVKRHILKASSLLKTIQLKLEKEDEKLYQSPKEREKGLSKNEINRSEDTAEVKV